MQDREIRQVRGSSGSVYEMRNVGGVYSCSCPALRNQSAPAQQRTCKHLVALRGPKPEKARLGTPAGVRRQLREPPIIGPKLGSAGRFDGLVDQRKA